MLIIERKVREAVNVIIPPSNAPQVVQVSLDRIRSNRIKLAFQAPPSIAIVRSELDRSLNKDEGGQEAA